MQPLFTIGHSRHSLEHFMALLQRHNVTVLADVRSWPYSQRFPHFQRAVLQKQLPQAEIRYVFWGKELGARPENPDCYVDGKASYEKIAAHLSFPRAFNGCLSVRKVSVLP